MAKNSSDWLYLDLDLPTSLLQPIPAYLTKNQLNSFKLYANMQINSKNMKEKQQQQIQNSRHFV